MGLYGFYTDHWSISAVNGEQTAMTGDFEFGVTPSVQAYSMLTSWGRNNGNANELSSGVIAYAIRDPATGVDSQIQVGALAIFEQQNLLLAQNVVRVTFGAAALVDGAEGWETQGDIVNQIWLWD